MSTRDTLNLRNKEGGYENGRGLFFSIMPQKVREE